MSDLSPYINTELYTSVHLLPSQMNNNLRINLRKNLEEKLLNICYKNYGYIMDIYKILDYKSGVIEAENLMGSAMFDLVFSCRLCIPIRNREIICQVNRVNKLLITVVNGPILVIVTNERINKSVFFSDINNNLRYKKDNVSHLLKPNEFVKITLLTITFNDGDDKIKAIGFLNNIATDEEIKNYYKDLYNKEIGFIEYKKYIEKQKEPEKSN